jgi:hypothetical protein
MVACGLERIRQAGEYAFAGMVDHRGLAVHQLPGTHDFPAVSLADALMAQAHAQNGKLTAQFLYRFHRHSRLVRRARARRDDDVVRFQLFNFRHRNLVVAIDAHVFAQLAQILHEVVGEGIVVIDHQ